MRADRCRPLGTRHAKLVVRTSCRSNSLAHHSNDAATFALHLFIGSTFIMPPAVGPNYNEYPGPWSIYGCCHHPSIFIYSSIRYTLPCLNVKPRGPIREIWRTFMLLAGPRFWHFFRWSPKETDLGVSENRYSPKTAFLCFSGRNMVISQWIFWGTVKQSQDCIVFFL